MNEEYFHSQVFKIFSDFPYRLTHTVVNRQFFQEMKKGENEFRIRCSFNAITNRSSSTNLLRFSMPRVVTIQKKFRIIKQFRSYQTLDEIYLRFEESLRGKRKKKWRKRKIGRKTSITIDCFYFPDCRHLRVHARVCFQTAATTIIDGEWWTVNNHTIVSARGGVIFERLESLQLHSD